MSGTNFGIYHPSNKPGTENKPNQGKQTFTMPKPVVKISDESKPTYRVSDFVMQLEDYVPTVPDQIILHYLEKCGYISDDNRLVRFISLVTQKFISDVTKEAFILCEKRNEKLADEPSTSKAPKTPKLTLTMEDLKTALAEYGIQVKTPYRIPDY